jgi:hypothetical protein
MSPWDLEPLDEQSESCDKFGNLLETLFRIGCPKRHGAGLVVTEAERQNLNSYDSTESGWPAIGRDAECERIQQGIEQIMQLSVAENFLVPVDLNQFPEYARFITYPIDLTTIKSRLENRFYRLGNLFYSGAHVLRFFFSFPGGFQPSCSMSAILKPMRKHSMNLTVQLSSQPNFARSYAYDLSKTPTARTLIQSTPNFHTTLTLP